MPVSTYVVDLTPEGKSRRKVRVKADSEAEARRKAIAKVYSGGGTRSFQVHNITRTD